MTMKNGKIWVQNVIFAGKRKSLNEFIIKTSIKVICYNNLKINFKKQFLRLFGRAK